MTSLRSFLSVAALMLLSGCGSKDGPIESHFEHDHQAAAHWPEDLASAANHIRGRLDALSANSGDAQQLSEEIADLISWVSEVAADTNLSEMDWVPIDNAAQSLADKLRAEREVLSASSQQQARELCALIDRTLPEIPEQLPSLKGKMR